MQRKEAARTGRAMAPRTPSYPVYTPPSRPAVPDTYDTYEAEKKKSFAKYEMPLLDVTQQQLTTLFLKTPANSWEGHAARKEVENDRYL